MLPLGLCNEIEGLVCKFWRGQRGEQQKIHWVKWGDMYDPKLEGGMGFKELVLFNEALLAKQTWRLLHNKKNLLSIDFLNQGSFHINLPWKPKNIMVALILRRASILKGMCHLKWSKMESWEWGIYQILGR